MSQIIKIFHGADSLDFPYVFTLLKPPKNIYRFLNKLSQNEDCPLADGWRVSNGLMLSVLLSVIGAINIIIPASKFLASLPIIGSGYVLLFFLALFMLIFLLKALYIYYITHI